MLPKGLLVASKRNGIIFPKYLNNTELAELVIIEFKKQIGKSFIELQRNLEYLENKVDDNYKIIRGLSVLLKRKCIFQPNTLLNCKEIRRFLFEKGFVIDKNERDKILEDTSKKFNATKSDIEKAIYGDLPEQQMLIKIENIKSEELVRKYNLSLTQTLLFNALELNLSVDSDFQLIFRSLKMLGLMYEIDDKSIKITGPASLFKKTKKYGVSFAKLFSYILKANKWEISAKVEIPLGNESKIYPFELKSSNNVLFPLNARPIVRFDSQVESQFYNKFKTLNSDWNIKREPTFVKAGNYVIIPDFGFYKFGMEYYLEIVGFWTPDYLEKKISKLNSAECKIIVAVNQNLNCKKEDFPGEVIFYKKNIPLKPILTILKNAEQTYIRSELSKIKSLDLSGDFISLKEKARELKICEDVIKKLKVKDYYIIGDKFVSKHFLINLKEKIGRKRPYTETINILNEFKLTLDALDYMDYTISWDGLIPINVIEKRIK